MVLFLRYNLWSGRCECEGCSCDGNGRGIAEDKHLRPGDVVRKSKSETSERVLRP